jgi:FtsP/CotA-like multicopper oxidase with cupredoxin domain
MRTLNAPLPDDSTPAAAQDGRREMRVKAGQPTRRAVLGGGVSAALWLPALAAEATTTLEAGLAGYNGASPGPLLRVTAGRRLNVRLVNRLAEPTSLYWPGLSGGFPGLDGAALAPGATRDVGFTPAQAGFHLYGPYGTSAGLFGAIVIDDPSPPAADLDAVVIFSGADAAGLRVNAGPAPLRLTAPPGGRVRLRLANASAALTLPLTASGATAHVIAIDGSPSELFEPRGGEFPLCPSGRIELMFDLGDAAVEFALPDRLALRIEPNGARAGAKPAIAALPAAANLPQEIALERALRVNVVLAGAPKPGFTINGVGGAGWPGKPLFQAKRGAPVSLTLQNRTASPQTLRLEGHAARQLHELDDGWDPYWRDALPLAPGRTLHAAFVAQTPGKWPLASASPDARAQGLKAWFQVS